MFDLTCRYLSTCSRAGTNFNKKKFPFCEDTVEYLGFKLTKDSIVPADSMPELIRNFPAPKNITEARDFFGLVVQVSFAFSKCADMIALGIYSVRRSNLFGLRALLKHLLWPN